MIDRNRIIQQLNNALPDIQEVQAAWLAGSDANNRADQWSDIDLRVVASPKHFTAIFRALEHSLSQLSPIDMRYHTPHSQEHLHQQRFYRLSNASAYNFVDLVLLEAGNYTQFLDSDRHGVGRVLVDRTGGIEFSSQTDDVALKAFAIKLKGVETRFKMFGLPLVEKAIKRNALPDAMHHYQTRVLSPIVELARAIHTPSRQDFGLRYLKVDLPHDLCQRVEALLLPKSLSHLGDQLQDAEQLFDELLEQYQNIKAKASKHVFAEA